MITAMEQAVKYYDSRDIYTPYHFGRALDRALQQYRRPGQELVFLCIGSDRATGDSLGPLVGHKLSQSRRFQPAVYGTLEHPVHAKNLLFTLGQIKKTHHQAFIIAIDASLGKGDQIGCISLKPGALRPGAGVSKSLPAVGDLSITGIVNACGIFDDNLLQTTRLGLVMRLADCICSGIHYSFPSAL